MIRSVRHFLLITLFASITIASSVTAIGNYLLDRNILSPLMDDQLYKTFSFVELTLEHATENKETRLKISRRLDRIAHSGPEKLFFAIFSPSDELLFHSDAVDLIPKKPTPIGFSNLMINDSRWRIYTNFNSVTHNRIVVAESYDSRELLAENIARNNIYILLFTYPLFGFLVWIIVIVALRSVTRVTNEIASRAPTWLEPVPMTTVPEEIQPLVSELNRLLTRVRLAFDRSRRFAGDAAHELRTPLAGIQTQAQVALRAEQPEDRDDALKKVIQGVNRTSHIVNQLLTLSRLGHEEELNDTHPVDLHRLATESLAALIPPAREKNLTVTLEPAPNRRQIIGNDVALDILMRNIIDNAIRYTPENGTIDVAVLHHGDKIIFRVRDSGPGIPFAHRKNVFDRFYRILGTNVSGSGLGLAIVLQIAKLHRAEIILDTPPNGTGLEFLVEFPEFSAE